MLMRKSPQLSVPVCELLLGDTISLNNKFRAHLEPSKMEFPLEGAKGTKKGLARRIGD